MIFFGQPSNCPEGQNRYAKIPSLTTHSSYRLLFLLCWELGEEITTLLRLRTSDAYLSYRERIPSPMLWVPCHGRPFRLREIPMPLPIELALRDHCPTNPYWLFPSPENPRQHLSFRASAKALERASKKAGLPSGCSPRQFKAEAIAHHRRCGMSLEQLSELSGLRPNSVQNHLLRIEAERPDLSKI